MATKKVVRVHECMTRTTKGRHDSNNSTWTAHIAIKSGRLDILKKLDFSSCTPNGFNPNASFRGERLLTTAVKRNDPNIVAFLFKNGADPNLKSEEDGRYEPPLMTLIRLGVSKDAKSTVFSLFMKHPHIDANVTNFYGFVA